MWPTVRSNDWEFFIGRGVSTGFESVKSPSLPGTWSNNLGIGIFGPTGFRGWSSRARRDFTLSGADATRVTWQADPAGQVVCGARAGGP